MANQKCHGGPMRDVWPDCTLQYILDNDVSGRPACYEQDE